MKNLLFLSSIFSLLLFASSCSKSNSTWEDVKTASRYMNKSIQSLWGSDEDSQLIASEEDFTGPLDEDFIPLRDQDLKSQFSNNEQAIAQPKMASETALNMKNFRDPSGEISSIFHKLHFDTDDHIIRTRADLINIAKIANHLKKNLKMHLLIEGHCDERASRAYNIALGMRRANHIRVLLVKQGVEPHRVYTVSLGKEKPVSTGQSDSHHLNRRAEFKVQQ